MKTPTLKLTTIGITACVLWLAACSEAPDPAQNIDDTNTPQRDQGPDLKPEVDMSDMNKAPDLPPSVDMNDMEDSPDMSEMTDMADMADMKPVDMGPDPRLLDTDYDRISDYDESMLCTDPNNFDTDGDLLNDYQELQLGTDPCDPDTDGDGLNDEREIYFGFDPNKTSSYDDNVLDGDRYIVRACDVPASEPADFYKNNRGDWRLSLPTAFSNYAELTINNAQAKEAAAVYDDPANEVSGFIFSATATASSDALATLLSYRPKIAQVGAIFQDLTEGEFDTHDRFKASPGEYRITASGKSARAVRDSLLFRLARFNEADASGLPTSAGNTHTKFYVRVTVIKRDDRLITTVAVAPEQLYDTRDQVKFRLSDLTNTTNVSQANDGNELRCHQFPANIEIPEADFYWVLDQSGSMDTHFTKVKAFAQDFYAQLLNTALDFRLGVTNMDKTYKGKLRPNISWHTDPTTFRNEIDNYVINCSPCDGGLEYGLYAAREGITYMKNSSTPINQRFRANATVATIFMTDEDDQSLKYGSDPGGPTIPRAQLLQNYTAFFASNPLAFSINGTGTNSCGDYGEGYEKAALASGGAVASLCANDLGSTISQILDIVAGRASTFRLPQTPISSTLRVYLGDETDPTQGRWVPRSRQDGFDYFPQSNSIAFFGSYRPQAGSDRGVQVAVHYQNFVDRTKTPPVANGGN